MQVHFGLPISRGNLFRGGAPRKSLKASPFTLAIHVTKALLSYQNCIEKARKSSSYWKEVEHVCSLLAVNIASLTYSFCGNVENIWQRARTNGVWRFANPEWGLPYYYQKHNLGIIAVFNSDSLRGRLCIPREGGQGLLWGHIDV